MDRTRKYDLEELSKMLQDPRLPKNVKRGIEETIYKVAHTSAPLRSLREDLVMATRAGDIDKIRKIQMHIHRVRQEETNGREIS